MSRSTIKSDAARTKSFALDAAKLMSELKCSDVVILDLVGRSQICDYMLIASGTSQRQMKSVVKRSTSWERRKVRLHGEQMLIVEQAGSLSISSMLLRIFSSQHSARFMTSKDFGLTRRAWLGVELRRHLAEYSLCSASRFLRRAFRKLKK